MENFNSVNSLTSESSKNESRIKYCEAPIDIPKEDDPDMFDANCDPANPVKIRFEDISMAEYKIRKGLLRTSCDKSRLSEGFGMKIYLKKEFQQYTGSFKERGARNALLGLTEERKKNGVIAASAGNHALALAYHGKNMNIPITVVMPTIAPLMKINSCLTFGAEVLLKGKDVNEAKRVALKMAKERSMTYVNGYDHPDVLAGQGTMGLQIAEQVPDVDAVIVPVGGGGLIAGTAVAMKTLNRDILIYGVESVNCPSLQNSLKAGKPVFTTCLTSIADGLSVSTVGINAFHTLKELVDRVIVVEEDFIALSILRLIEVEKNVVEGAGAAALAPILAGKVPELLGKR